MIFAFPQNTFVFRVFLTAGPSPGGVIYWNLGFSEPWYTPPASWNRRVQEVFFLFLFLVFSLNSDKYPNKTQAIFQNSSVPLRSSWTFLCEFSDSLLKPLRSAPFRLRSASFSHTICQIIDETSPNCSVLYGEQQNNTEIKKNILIYFV